MPFHFLSIPCTKAFFNLCVFPQSDQCLVELFSGLIAMWWVGGFIRVESWWDVGLVVGGGFVVRRRWCEEVTVLRKDSLLRLARWRFGVALGLDE